MTTSELMQNLNQELPLNESINLRIQQLNIQEQSLRQEPQLWNMHSLPLIEELNLLNELQQGLNS